MFDMKKDTKQNLPMLSLLVSSVPISSVILLFYAIWSLHQRQGDKCIISLSKGKSPINRTFAVSTGHSLIQYIPRNMHTVFALLCFVVVIHWLIFPYPSGLLHWHCGNLTIAPVPAKQPWWIWINTSCEFIMNDCITTTKQSTTKPCAYFLGYTVPWLVCDLGICITIASRHSCKPHWGRLTHIQYIPRNMHMVLLCFALLWLCNRS